MDMLTSIELERYSRQMMIGEIGRRGQEKLKAATVLVAGAGGLGSAVAIYLAAAGIGRLRVMDDDTVALSNLNRQILHRDRDLGRKKADSAEQTLCRVNPSIRIEAFAERLTAESAGRRLDGCDLVVDALDNQESRYLLNRAAVDHHLALIHGAVRGFEGRAMTVLPGRSACLRCMHREKMETSRSPVIGVTPAVIGAIQATEAIKCILGIGDVLSGRLLAYDGLSMTFTAFRVHRHPDCDHCGQL